MTDATANVWTNWVGVLGIGLCLLALAIVFAVGVGFYLVRQLFIQQRTQRLQKAEIFRTELIVQLRFLEERLTPRNRPLDRFENELFEPLQAMWMQADLLEPEEMQVVHRLFRSLFMLRKKPSLNKKDLNVVMDLIHQTYQVFDRTSENKTAESVKVSNWTNRTL
jgi:hypothetical protein